MKGFGSGIPNWITQMKPTTVSITQKAILRESKAVAQGATVTNSNIAIEPKITSNNDAQDEADKKTGIASW